MESLTDSINSGVYSTYFKSLPTNNIWSTAHEATFGDYMTMKEGDKVFFFHKRKLYGIGELVTVQVDCKLLNFPKSDLLEDESYSHLKESMIINNSKKNLNNRMLCTFKASPLFFKDGVDMDEVLSSNPENFKMLRAFWKLSFIKLDDIETKSLFDIVLKNNESNLKQQNNLFKNKSYLHERVQKIVDSRYQVSSSNILSEYANKDGSIRHEMAIELGTLEYISNQKTNIFGTWDYLSHQVIASPFKPIDYMDKMDIFGYRYIENYTTISKFLVVEIKKDFAGEDELNQLMKYVDWINQEYSFGDYNMIEAFLIANSFPKDIEEIKKQIAIRNYTKSRRPPISSEWANLRLIKYNFNSLTNTLEFEEI